MADIFRRSSQSGFTILEGMIAATIGIVFLSSVIGLWMFSARVWKEEGIRSQLRYQVEVAMEKIKYDIRLSDGNGVLFYPAGASSYTAISIPRAIPNASGFLSFQNGAIQWDKTVIYHLYSQGGKTELRQTTFNSFDASSANRQTQLSNVVSGGSGASASTVTLFKAGTVSMTIVPQYPTFDGYAPSAALSENTDFGSIRLTAGSHTIRFEVTGKNAASSGYGIGIDQLTLSPSGAPLEAETLLPVNASSGGTASKEDMSAIGAEWGGNHQLAFSSSGIGNYVTVQTNYDLWRESNFQNFSRTNLVIEGSDPFLTIESRESQSMSPAWQADAQTGVEPAGNTALPDRSVRTIISGGLISRSATMVRFKFLASTNDPLTIQSAYFGVRSGAGPDFAAVPTQLYFNNGTLEEGAEDGVGAVGAIGPTSITIEPGHHAWSNWFEYSIDTSGAVPDHLLSIQIPNDSSSSHAMTWVPEDNTVTNSYLVNGSHAADVAGWAGQPGFSADPNIYASSQMATWMASGTAVSQIYDTQMAAPVFNQIKWDPTLPEGASIRLKIRTSADANMAGATDWSAITGTTVSPSAAGVASQRYVQYQATLTAASPYISYPKIDNITLDWPGQAALVQLGGYFTKRPNYGIFKILVDGNPTVKALELKLHAGETNQGKALSFSLNSEIKSRNTGK